jgi:hypothetical protein
MAEHYYTEAMKDFTSKLDNVHNFPVTISQFDHEGEPCLVLSFEDADLLEYGDDKHALFEVASYLIELRNGLISLGARVTFFVRDGGDNAETSKYQNSQ